jgi:cytochrome c556
MRWVQLTAGALAAWSVAGAAVTQTEPTPPPPAPPVEAAAPTDPLADRKANMRAMYAALTVLQTELRRRAPVWDKIDPAAADLAARAQDVKAWFPEGSGAGAVRASRARALIWTQGEQFEAEAMELMLAAAPLKALADARQAGELNAQLTPVFRACISCHGVYREKLSGR